MLDFHLDFMLQIFMKSKLRVADIGVIFSKDNYNLNGNIYHCILKEKDYWCYVKLWKNKSCLCVFYSKVLSLSS